MSFATHGKSTLRAEVTHISDSELRVSLDGEVLSLPFDLFPWFRGAKESEVRKIERPALDQLRWPDLDVELEVESIRHPERFPLVWATGDRQI